MDLTKRRNGLWIGGFVEDRWPKYYWMDFYSITGGGGLLIIGVSEA